MKLSGKFLIIFFSFLSSMSMTLVARRTRVLLINQRVAQAGVDKAMHIIYKASGGKIIAFSMGPGEYVDLDKIVLLKIYMHSDREASNYIKNAQYRGISELPIKDMGYVVVRIIDADMPFKPYSIKVDKVSMPTFLAEKAKCTTGMTLNHLLPEILGDRQQSATR